MQCGALAGEGGCAGLGEMGGESEVEEEVGWRRRRGKGGLSGGFGDIRWGGFLYEDQGRAGVGYIICPFWLAIGCMSKFLYSRCEFFASLRVLLVYILFLTGQNEIDGK